MPVTTFAGTRPAAAPAGRRSRTLLPALDTTPGRLALLRAALIVLALLLAVSSTVTAVLAANGTRTLTHATEPLLVNAESIYSGLADADTTAAQAFLSGGLEPAAQSLRYTADIDRVGDQLAQAAGRAGQSGPAADAIRTLATALPVYSGLIQSARANNRQGLPVGASYLGQASTLSRKQMLPAADQLLTIEQHQTVAGYDAARASTPLLVTGGIAVALLLTLLVTQLWLTRRTRRLLNVGLLAATVTLLLAAALTAGILELQRHRLATAQRTGSTPVAAAARARIAALVEHGDDSLTLVSRSTSAAYEKDFAAAQASLLGDASHPGLLPPGSQARSLEQAYLVRHNQVRALDDGGNYNAAVAAATSTAPDGAETAFAALDAELTQTVTTAQSRFTSAAGHAGSGLTLLEFLAPLLALIICALSILGIRARLEEYR
jgi:hypothetical protein